MYRYIAFDVETPNRYNNRMSAIGISVIENGTIKGVRQLRFIRSEKIERMDERAMKAEQDAFQKAFAEELQRITE